MAQDYSQERGNPNTSSCGQITLRFALGVLTMRAGDRTYSYHGELGRAGKYEAIPRGRYWIQPDQLWHCNPLRSMIMQAQGSSCNDSGWGMYRITIHPFPATGTSGRGGFFIHGGSHIGSAGCINLGLKVSDFVRDLEKELGGNSTCYIPLEVL